MDYISFHIPEWTSAHASNCVCILRGVIDESDCTRNRYTAVEALLLSVSKDLSCVDLSLYKVYLNTFPVYSLAVCAALQNFISESLHRCESLIQERQIVLLFNGTTAASDSSKNALLMMIQTSDLPFVPLSGSINLNLWDLDQLQVGISLVEYFYIIQRMTAVLFLPLKPSAC